jgi:hypothetical protein
MIILIMFMKNTALTSSVKDLLRKKVLLQALLQLLL